MSNKQNLTLYTRPLCGFCVRVKYFLKKNGLNIPERNIWTDKGAGDELRSGGGNSQVPCLRIENETGEVQWLYESADIITYLGSVT